MVTPGNENSSCTPELSLWALYTMLRFGAITGLYLTRKGVSQKRIQRKSLARHMPSTRHAALPGRSSKENHWHVTINLAARHYCIMFAKGLKSGPLCVLKVSPQSPIPLFNWISRTTCTWGVSAYV